jgi:hypothetical protein
MRSRKPYRFSTNETLSPKKLIGNFQALAQLVTDKQAERYSYGSFVLDFDGVTSAADPSLKTYKITAPRAYDIVGAEVILYQATTASVTLSCSASGFTSISVDAAGATTRSYSYKNQACHVNASTATNFILTVSAGTVTSCKVIIHYRSDRFSSAPSNYTLSDVIAIRSGDTVSASDLNTEFTEIDTAVTAHTSNTSDLRIQVITRRAVISPFPTTDTDIRLPSSGRIINSFDVGVVAAVTNDFVATLNDEASVSVGSGTATAAGATTLATTTVSVNDTQTQDDPDDPTDDYTLVLSRSGAGAANILFGYVAIYYT